MGDMYHFLSSDMTKLNIENYKDFYFDANMKEKHDYVLVNEKVWRLLKNYYGGGPEIPFFLVDDAKRQIDFNISQDANFLFHQPYIYGYPDKAPKYLDLQFVVISDMSEELLRVDYSILVSYAMSFRQLIYYWSCRLNVEVGYTLVKLMIDGSMPIDFTESDSPIAEIFNYAKEPKLELIYNGDLGKSLTSYFCTF